jgi:hypothetical protein
MDNEQVRLISAAILLMVRERREEMYRDARESERNKSTDSIGSKVPKDPKDPKVSST